MNAGEKAILLIRTKKAVHAISLTVESEWSRKVNAGKKAVLSIKPKSKKAMRADSLMIGPEGRPEWSRTVNAGKKAKLAILSKKVKSADSLTVGPEWSRTVNALEKTITTTITTIITIILMKAVIVCLLVVGLE